MRKDSEQIGLETADLYTFIWDNFDRQQWEAFSDAHFYNWSRLPLEDDFYQGKVCLDAGCGSGRATRNMLLYGAGKVFAIDIGEGCIRNTRERNQEFSDRLDTRVGSVLQLPYEDSTFDFVHCDGVLHHTPDPNKGFQELVRVLKPGGKIVIGVYGRGGLLNFTIYAARLFRHIIPKKFTYAACRFSSKNPVTWYAVMDCMYVPIRRNYYESEIRRWLERAPLTNIQRLDSQWGPYTRGRWFKGEGYLKFIADKK